MSIDWVNVIAMVVNFLVLVFLLRRFLYGPILKIMDEREQKITRREEAAAAKARRAEEVAAAYREKMASLQARDQELLEEARRAAAAERSSLTAAARLEVDQMRRRWQEALAREKESFARELRRRVAGQACLIARRCLQDLADARLEEMVWHVFLTKVERLPAEERSKVKAALSAEGAKLQVRSAFDLDQAKLEQLQGRLGEMLSVDFSLDYRTDPGLVCGLELEAGGHRVAWSVDSYLEDVEKHILQSLESAEQLGGEVDAS